MCNEEKKISKNKIEWFFFFFFFFFGFLKNRCLQKNHPECSPQMIQMISNQRFCDCFEFDTVNKKEWINNKNKFLGLNFFFFLQCQSVKEFHTSLIYHFLCNQVIQKEFLCSWSLTKNDFFFFQRWNVRDLMQNFDDQKTIFQKEMKKKKGSDNTTVMSQNLWSIFLKKKKNQKLKVSKEGKQSALFFFFWIISIYLKIINFYYYWIIGQMSQLMTNINNLNLNICQGN